MNVKVASKTDPIETFVAESDQGDTAAIGRFKIGRALSDVGECSDALEAQAFGVEGLTESKVDVVAAIRWRRTRHHIGREINPALIAAEHRDGVSGVAVGAVAGQLHADLVVTVAKVVRASGSIEVIDLINAAVVGEEQKTFLGNQVVEFESAEPDIEPGAVLQIIEADPGGLKVPNRGGIRGGQQHE